MKTQIVTSGTYEVLKEYDESICISENDTIIVLGEIYSAKCIVLDTDNDMIMIIAEMKENRARTLRKQL